jgi:hypothetical protein
MNEEPEAKPAGQAAETKPLDNKVS